MRAHHFGDSSPETQSRPHWDYGACRKTYGGRTVAAYRETAGARAPIRPFEPAFSGPVPTSGRNLPGPPKLEGGHRTTDKLPLEI